MTNKEIVYHAIAGAEDAHCLLDTVINDLESIIDSEAPLMERLNIIKDNLILASDIMYELNGGSSCSIRVIPENEECQGFIKWLEEN